MDYKTKPISRKFDNISQALTVKNIENSPFRMACHDENWRNPPCFILNGV